MELEHLEVKDWQSVIDQCNEQLKQAKLMFSINRAVLAHAKAKLKDAEQRARGGELSEAGEMSNPATAE